MTGLETGTSLADSHAMAILFQSYTVVLKGEPEKIGSDTCVFNVPCMAN